MHQLSACRADAAVQFYWLTASVRASSFVTLVGRVDVGIYVLGLGTCTWGATVTGAVSILHELCRDD
jgi:hypothetical protein